MFVDFSTLTDNECMFCCTGNECPDVTVHWMTHYVVYSAAAIGEVSSWHTKSKLSCFSVLFPYAVITDGPHTSSERFALTATTTGFLLLPLLVQSVKDTSDISQSATNKSEVFRQKSTWMNRLDVCVLKSQNSFDEWESDDCLKVSVKVHILL